MDYSFLDGKTLYFEMVARPEKSPGTLHEIHGITTLRASKATVSMMWVDYPGAASGKSVTFDRETPSKFRPNDEKRSFQIDGKEVIPDFIYIEKL